jgi:hypothetical protein
LKTEIRPGSLADVITAGGRGWWQRIDQAADGLAADAGLYTLSAAFAGVTAATSTLLPHRAWGSIAIWGYAVAALAAITSLLPGARWLSTPRRAALTWLTWGTTALLPLIVEAVQRSGGRTDRAQEEVLVIEQAGQRLVDHGTPYLSHAAIAALPQSDRLLGYLPYQPGMALFGLPRAAFGAVWWTDARVWFALVTAVALVAAILLVTDAPGAAERGRGAVQAALVRGVQAVTVLPLCALTLATGGDDLPVLALCLLALVLCARRRHGAAGLVVGAASALKLFAWPVAAVLLIHAITQGRRTGVRFVAGALGLPVVTVLPALFINADALVENVIRFPLGRGLVTSPAQSPFPGHLIASGLPAGHTIAAALLALAGLAIAIWLIRRPPRTAATAAMISGYGLLAAILLMPSTRFGYLLYPAALLVWVIPLWLADPPGHPSELVAGAASGEAGMGVHLKG